MADPVSGQDMDKGLTVARFVGARFIPWALGVRKLLGRNDVRVTIDPTVHRHAPIPLGKCIPSKPTTRRYFRLVRQLQVFTAPAVIPRMSLSENNTYTTMTGMIAIISPVAIMPMSCI